MHQRRTKNTSWQLRTPPSTKGHSVVPQWERLHIFHRDVSYHCTAVNCSVGSFIGNSKPRETSLKSTHGPNPPQFLLRSGPRHELKEVSRSCMQHAIRSVRNLKRLNFAGLARNALNSPGCKV